MSGVETLGAGAELTLGVALLVHAKKAATSIKATNIAIVFRCGFIRFIKI